MMNDHWPLIVDRDYWLFAASFMSRSACRCASCASCDERPRLCSVWPMLLPLFKPFNSASAVIAGFFELRFFATMLAAMNWPRDNLGFAALAVSYALCSASGVVPSFVATARGNVSLLDFGAVLDGFDGWPIGVCRTRVAWAGLPCAVAVPAATSARPATTTTAMMVCEMGFICSPPGWPTVIPTHEGTP